MGNRDLRHKITITLTVSKLFAAIKSIVEILAKTIQPFIEFAWGEGCGPHRAGSSFLSFLFYIVDKI